MDEKVVNLLGYHGTSSNSKESIDKNGLDPSLTKHRDDHWLGQGVYFFEEFDQAMWWAEDISTKSWNRGSVPLVYHAVIEAEESEVLNLDDYKVMNRFMDEMINLQKSIEPDKNGRFPKFTEEKMRAVFLDYYKNKHNIFVVIYTFEKNCISYGTYRKGADYHSQSQLFKTLHMGYKEKQICVSDKKCITDLVLVYNGEDEVV